MRLVLGAALVLSVLGVGYLVVEDLGWGPKSLSCASRYREVIAPVSGGASVHAECRTHAEWQEVHVTVAFSDADRQTQVATYERVVRALAVDASMSQYGRLPDVWVGPSGEKVEGLAAASGLPEGTNMIDSVRRQWGIEPK
jgi:hypothetical protein